MKKLTKREIKKKYKATQPLLIDIIWVVFGLIFEIGVPAVALFLGIITISFDPLIGVLILIVVFPIVLGIGLMLFRGVLFSTVKKRLSTRVNAYKIVRAKCINIKPSSIDTETGEATTFRYTFQADDGKIDATDIGIPKGHTAYLVVAGTEVVVAFDAQDYYTNNYSTSLGNPNKPHKAQKHSSNNFKNALKKVSGYFFLEFWLFGVIAFDVIGFLKKEWSLALGSGLLMIFYFLGSIIGQFHAKVTGIITLIYLFINGILFYYLSYTYNHSTSAYIVGTVYILISLLSSIIWIKKTKK